MPDRTGQQLGNYRLVRPLGQGGFADVYLGQHIHLNTYAAIKILHNQLAEESINDFRAEGRTLAALKHPNIVQVLDFGIDGLTPYLVMEYAPNGTLRQRHPRGTPVPLNVVISYVRQVASALQFAHNQKIIHRDIKPENMLIGEQNQILLSDFGIAVVTASARADNPVLAADSWNSAGTVSYMAPEQIQGKTVLASDQYALATVVYEWLTGSVPFQGMYMEVVTQQMSATPVPMRQKNPSIPPDVEQVVLTALNKDPQRRFMRVEVFATALEQAAQADISPLVSVPATAIGGQHSTNKQEVSAMTATLVGPLGRITIGAAKVTIGRAPDNSLVLDDARASAHHAEILAEGAYFRLVDLGSSNGTFVNEQQVFSTAPRLLQPGDKIRIGQTLFTFEMSDAPQATSYADGSTVLAGPSPAAPATPPNFAGMTGYGMANMGYSMPPGYQDNPPAQPYMAPPPYVSETQMPTYVQPSYTPNGQPSFTPNQQPVYTPAQQPLYTPNQQPMITGNQQKPPRKKSRLMLWIGLIVLVVVLLAGGGVFAYLDLLASTATKTLDAFCSGLQGKNYQNAYNQFSVDYQAKNSESTFQKDYAAATSCTHSSATTSGGNTVSTVTLAPAASYPWTYQMTLVKDSSGTWKIDNVTSAPDLTLNTFCSEIQNKDYQDAYNLLTPNYQTQYSQTNFTQYFSAASSCSASSATLANSVTSTTLNLGPASTYPWTYQLTLAKQGNGSWKIDSFTSAPDTMLDKFCTDIQNKDYQDAYNQTSSHYQSSVQSESDFQNALSSATSCSHTQTTTSNNANTSIVTFGGFVWDDQVTLIKDSNNNWKIDGFEGLPDITLNAYCTDMQNRDFTDAYALTDTGFQNSVSAAQFESDRASVTGCTHDPASTVTGSVTATITYTLSDGSTAKQIAVLVKDSNDDGWKFDSFTNA
jgi:serine/threonine protein kinase